MVTLARHQSCAGEGEDLIHQGRPALSRLPHIATGSSSRQSPPGSCAAWFRRRLLCGTAIRPECIVPPRVAMTKCEVNAVAHEPIRWHEIVLDTS
jgi:hypothetical protein